MLYITPDNKLHDDAEGLALTLPCWPSDAKPATLKEIENIQNIPKSLEQTTKEFEDTVQNYMDSKAKEKGYDNILSACSYAGAPNPFQEEAINFISWRGAVWAYCYEQLEKVKSEEREFPTVEQIIIEISKI